MIVHVKVRELHGREFANGENDRSQNIRATQIEPGGAVRQVSRRGRRAKHRRDADNHLR
jgi:hypothetical protein